MFLDETQQKYIWEKNKFDSQAEVGFNSQAESLVVVGRPGWLLRLGDLPTLLVGQVGSDQVHFHERLEGLGSWPLQIVGSDD